MLLLGVSTISLRVPCPLLSLRSHAVSKCIFFLVSIIDEPISFDLARSNTWRCDGCRSGLHHIISVIIDFIGGLFDFFHLDIELIRQLLKLSARIRGHQRWVPSRG